MERRVEQVVQQEHVDAAPAEQLLHHAPRNVGTANRFRSKIDKERLALGEELWLRLGHGESLAHAAWPTFDPALCADDTVTVAVQVNGKLRATLDLPRGAEQAAVQAAALADERVGRFVDGGTIRKAIYVQDRLLNLVVAAAT